MLSTKLFPQKQMGLFLSCMAVKGGKGGISLPPWDAVQKMHYRQKAKQNQKKLFYLDPL